MYGGLVVTLEWTKSTVRIPVPISPGLGIGQGFDDWYREARGVAQEAGPILGVGGRTVPAGAVAGIAGTATGPRASARRAPLARLGRIAGRARVGPGEEGRAPEDLC